MKNKKKKVNTSVRYDRNKVVDEIEYIENELSDALRCLHNLKRSFFYPAPSTALDASRHQVKHIYSRRRQRRNHITR